MYGNGYFRLQIVRLRLVGIGLVLAYGGQAQTTQNNVTWQALNPAEPGWEEGTNWDPENLPPANPTPGTIQYGSGSQGVTGVMDADRQVGGVSLSAVTASHTVDLNGKILTVAGLFRSRLNGTLTLQNGTLRIGTDAITGNFTVGSVSSSPSTPTVVKLDPGMTLDTYRVGNIRLDATTATHVNHQNPRLDLRGVTIARGMLAAQNIWVETNSRNAGGSYIALDAATAIDSIAVTNQLIVGGGQFVGMAYIGNPDDASKRLPPDVNLRVGHAASRGLLEVGRSAGGSASDFILSSSAGGDIVAYLTDLIVMRYTGTGTAILNGTLDLSTMTSCTIDVLNVELGVNVQNRIDGRPRGTIKLPAGSLIAQNTVIGGSTGLGYGRFETSNTVVTVTNALTLDKTGELTIRMGATPAGWSAEGSFTDGGGKIHVDFLAVPTVATNWALRVAGDQQKLLHTMAGSGRLTSSGSFSGWKAGIVYDGTYTYFAMVDDAVSFPVVALAGDGMFEIEPGGTVLADITEVDAGSYDPEGRAPVSVTMSRDGLGGPFGTTLSFDVANDYPVTVKIEVGDPVENTDTDTGTVSIVALDPGTPSGVTWLGAASTVLMDRREWWWKGSWLGGVPPANPTAGTITFAQYGQSVMGMLEQDRQVGGIGTPDTTYNHALNLGGHSLTVAGTFLNTLWGTFDLTNGTLRIGTDTTAGNVTVGGGWGTSTPSTTILRPGMVFDTHHVNTIRLGSVPPFHVNNQNARLDLRGVIVKGGVLAAQDILMHAHTRNAGGSYIGLDAATGLNTIAVTNQLIVGRGREGGRTFIGDPADSERLPPGIAIRVGSSTAQRGFLEVGSFSTGSDAGNVTLAASSGGDIVAYLTDLIVLKYTGTGTAILNGTLDLGKMTGCTIDTLHFEVGRDHTGRSDARPRGTIVLPPGTLTTGTAVIGGELCVNGYGRVTTSNTLFTVTDTLTLNTTGEIILNMGSEPIGLDIAGALMDAGGKIHVNFLEEPKEGIDVNWAVRIAGDAQTTLNTLVGSSRLTSIGTFEGWNVGVVYDGDYTYFAMLDATITFPPVAVAKDVTFEIEPGGTVWVDITEVDGGSYDPAERTPVAITMSRDGAGGPFDTQLAFDSAADYPVTVRIEVGDPVEDTDTDTGTLSIVPLDPGSEANRTWGGDASTALMTRREWWWQKSWIEGSPPTNPTPGTIMFAQYGTDKPGILEQDRQVGGINLSAGTRSHGLDFGGHTLTVAGTLQHGMYGHFELTNGTLRIGTATAPGHLTLGGGSGGSTPSTLLLRPGMTFDPHRLGTIHFVYNAGSHFNNQNSRFDLRGVTVAGGLLAAQNLRLHVHHRNTGGSYIAIDETTAIEMITATNDFYIGRGAYGGRAFIGNPDDPDRRLPPNISLRIGSGPTQRGILEVGAISGGSETANITLAASAGGDIVAWLTSLTVMDYTGTGTAQLNGTLDLAAMDACFIDTGTFTVGPNTAGTAAGKPRGTVRLPPGTVKTGSAAIGAADGDGFGLVELNGTHFEVVNTIAIRTTGAMTVNVGANASGLTLSDRPDALTVAAGATLTLRFGERGSVRPHYGLKWAGLRATTLRDMELDGRLQIDDAGMAPWKAVVFEHLGDTYVGVPPPKGTLFRLR